MSASKEFLASQPKKRTSGGALIFNERGELLIVKPNYKDHWMIVGGMSDAYESPKQTCEKEIKEEIGIDIEIDRLLCVDYMSNLEKEDEFIAFFFLAKTITDSEIDKIIIQEDELDEFKFVDREEALELIGGGGRRRLPASFDAVDENTFKYLENGVVV